MHGKKSWPHEITDLLQFEPSPCANDALQHDTAHCGKNVSRTAKVLFSAVQCPNPRAKSYTVGCFFWARPHCGNCCTDGDFSYVLLVGNSGKDPIDGCCTVPQGLGLRKRGFRIIPIAIFPHCPRTIFVAPGFELRLALGPLHIFLQIKWS